MAKTLRDSLLPVEGANNSNVPSLDSVVKSQKEYFIDGNPRLNDSQILSEKSAKEKTLVIEEIQRYKPPKKKNLCVRVCRVL